MDQITLQLFAMRDDQYRDFQSKLIPNVPKDRVIGIRTPQLRRFAKDFGKTPESQNFLANLPHFYYEENNLHGFLIEQLCDFEETVAALDAFLPYVDNWATCDMTNPKSLKSDCTALLPIICRWLASEHTYVIRFGIKTLMQYYLDENFSPLYPEMVLRVESKEYYVNMMRAWYFATALAFQYEKVFPYIAEKRLDDFTHGKTIQKACESFRLTKEQKDELKNYR